MASASLCWAHNGRLPRSVADVGSGGFKAARARTKAVLQKARLLFALRRADSWGGQIQKGDRGWPVIGADPPVAPSNRRTHSALSFLSETNRSFPPHLPIIHRTCPRLAVFAVSPLTSRVLHDDALVVTVTVNQQRAAYLPVPRCTLPARIHTACGLPLPAPSPGTVRYSHAPVRPDCLLPASKSTQLASSPPGYSSLLTTKIS